jgi:UDP-N-acetyl-D-mannosaminuronate dehydrogenase
MASEQKLIVVVGLGEIGRPLYDLILKAYPKTRGIDLEPVAINEPVGLMQVCFPHDLAQGFVATTVSYAKKYRPEVIVVNSTVKPGTTREIQKATGLPTVYSPIRGKHVRMHDDILKYQKFVAGQDKVAVERAKTVFSRAGMKVATMDTPEALELAKLCETTYFGVLLAWAQEMERFSKKMNADYFDLVRFFEEIDYLPRVTFRPGHIGGHCIMPNIAILKSRFESGFLDAIVASNELKAVEIKGQGGSLGERIAPLKLGEKPR